MRFVERLGAGVRVRLAAEQLTADSYGNSGVSKKLAHLISTFACSRITRRRRWFRKQAEHITHVRYHTYGHLPETGVSEFTYRLEHELDGANDPGRALPSFSALSTLLLLRYQTAHVSWIVLHGT